jgi:hypothetical protein
MTVQELMWSHRYAEAVIHLRQDLAKNPEDKLAIEWMAKALRALGEYGESLLHFERLAGFRRDDNVASILAPGSAAWQIDIACLHWLLRDHTKAISLMHGLTAGTLDGTIKYGDEAGGMSQGLLLYYMAVTSSISDEASFALDFLRDRVKWITRTMGALNDGWRCRIARQYLGEVPFESVVDAIEHPRHRSVADPATIELAKRRRLVVALFHSGIRSRALGEEKQCLARMRECYGLENPLIDDEWYLARYEVEKADRQT